MAPGNDRQRRRALRQLLLSQHRQPDPTAAQADPLMAGALRDWQSGRITDYHALKALAALAALRNDPNEWLRLLAGFDPDLALVPSDAPPRLGGIGPGALNSGRILTVDGETRYEKIYLAGSRCLLRMLHAHEAVLEPLRPVTFPPIRRQRRGKRLVAVEFAFVDGLQAGLALPELALGTAARLGAIPMSDSAIHHHLVEQYPRDLRWAETRLMGQHWQRGQALARRLNLPAPVRAPVAAVIDRIAAPDRAFAARLPGLLARWSGRVQATSRVFSHGDLNRTNLTAAGVVIDWDNAAWRAHGHDAAYATAFHSDANNMGALLALSAARVERAGSERADRFAYLYFLLHLLPEAGQSRMDASLAGDLVTALEKLEGRL